MADDCELCDGCGEIEAHDKHGKDVTVPCPTCVSEELRSLEPFWSAAAEAQIKQNEILERAMAALYRGYVSTLAAGRDRIIESGGDCDSLDAMVAGDPVLIAAREILSPHFIQKEGR